MTERNIDLIKKIDKKKMAEQQKTAAANRSKSTTNPLVRKPTGPKQRAPYLNSQVSGTPDTCKASHSRA
jgi:hypothetical protein